MLFSVVSNFAETLFWFCEKLRHSRHTAVETIIYYSTYYLEKKKWVGQPYKFQSHAHLLILWCPLLKEKKKISALRSYSHRLFQSSASQHKNKQTNKNHNVEKKTVFKIAIVIAVKKIMKIRKIDWNLLTRKKRKQKQTRTRKNKTNNPCFTTFFLFIKFGHDDERKQKNCYHYYRYNNTQINYYTL